LSPIARQILQDDIVLPFVLALVLQLIGRPLLAWARVPSAAAGVALVAGFLAAFLSAYGPSALLPHDAASKLPALAFAGLLLGAGLDHAGPPRVWLRLAPALIATAVVGWLVWPRIASGATVASGLLLWGAGAMGLTATAAAGGRPGRQFAMVIGLAAGLAGIAFFARTISIMQLALGLAASLAGLALATRLAGGCRLPLSALLPTGALLLGLGSILALYSAAPPLALAPLVALPLAHQLSLPLARIGRRREGTVFVLLCVGLPALAVLVARLMLGPPGLH
jgi:hypothetical protein